MRTMTEKQKRAVYKLAFGKEYDDPKRRQHALPLDLAYQVALEKIKTTFEAIRKSILAENISFGEIVTLQGLKKYINKNDTLLLEWVMLEEGEK